MWRLEVLSLDLSILRLGIPLPPQLCLFLTFRTDQRSVSLPRRLQPSNLVRSTVRSSPADTLGDEAFARSCRQASSFPTHLLSWDSTARSCSVLV